MKSRYFTLTSLFTLLIICILYYKNQNTHSQLFDIQVVDAIHTPKINSFFEKADAAKYAQDYRKADNEFRHLLSKKLSVADSQYIFNQLAYIHLMMNEDSIAHQWMQFYEKTTLTTSIRGSSDSITSQADYNFNVGIWAYHTFKPKMAEIYLNEALKRYKRIYGGQHLRVALCLTQLGMMHYEFNQAQGLSSNYLTDAYDIFQTNKELKKYSATAELGMGLFNFMMRNHEIAQANCENAIYLVSNSIFKDSILLARATSYRGQMLKKKAEVIKDTISRTILIDSAEVDFRNGINILKGINTPRIQELYRNIAVLYCYTKDSTKFWPYIDTLNSLVQKQGNYYGYTERLKGYFYYFKEENTKTVSQYKLFLDKYSTDSLCSTALLDEAYWVIIDNFNNLRLYDSSIAYNLRLMQSNGAEKLDINHLLSNPSEVNNENAFIPLSFLGYSLLHKYETNKDINVLKQAVRAYRLADSCMFSRTSFDEENTAIRLQIDVGKELYNNGLQSVYELYSKTGDTSLLNIAFLFIERMKSSILFRDINMQANDDSIRLLKSQFDQLLGEREVSKHSNYELSDKLTQISRLLNKKFKNPIQNQAQGLPMVQDVLNVIDKEQTIAFYFYGQPSYALYINHKGTIFKQIKSDSLSFNIEKYRTSLSNTTQNHIKSQEADFKEASCFLYNQLIKPFEKSLAQQKELIIIPDAELHNIPFESFLEHKNWTSLKMLLF